MKFLSKDTIKKRKRCIPVETMELCPSKPRCSKTPMIVLCSMCHEAFPKSSLSTIVSFFLLLDTNEAILDGPTSDETILIFVNEVNEPLQSVGKECSDELKPGI